MRREHALLVQGARARVADLARTLGGSWFCEVTDDDHLRVTNGHVFYVRVEIQIDFDPDDALPQGRSPDGGSARACVVKAVTRAGRIENAALGLVLWVAATVPALALGIPGGAWIDRIQRRPAGRPKAGWDCGAVRQPQRPVHLSGAPAFPATPCRESRTAPHPRPLSLLLPTQDQAMTTRMRFDRLQTERLIMRRWQESDWEPFAELNADPEAMRFFPNTLDRAASNALIETIETRFDRQGFGFWALEVAATGTFIGFTGLNPLPDGVPGAGGMEVGWRLARHAWHHGYATEAARAALGVAFDNMGLPEIWSLTAVLNEPSQAVMRRLGLTETTRFDHPRIPPGDPLRPQVAYHGTRPAASKLP